MTTNAEKQAAYRARKKAEKLTASSSTVTPDALGGPVPGVSGVGVAEPALKINVKAEATAPHKPTLRERLGLGGNKSTVPASAKKGKKAETPNLIVTVLPTLAASLIAAWARDRIPEEYQPCAPTKQEVKEIIGPLLEILGDQVEVAAKMSANTMRLINSLICGMAYGVRAYVTYVEIKKAKELGYTYAQAKQQQANEYREKLDHEARDYHEVINDDKPFSNGLRSYQAANNGTDSNSLRADVSRPGSGNNGASGDGADDTTDDQQLRNYEASLVTQMFARDKLGRQQLGLLPRAV